tara:strand:- start:565 stop:951 length:387 start_codon:yes stop_codon:yes gene_type:complete
VNHLTKVNLFKKWNYPSWSIYKYGDMGITIKKDNQVTNWDKYFKANVQAGLEGTGYILHRYKKADGIKKTVVGKTYANYLNANDKKYYGMTGKQYYNFTEKDYAGYQDALAFTSTKKQKQLLNKMEAA